MCKLLDLSPIESQRDLGFPKPVNCFGICYYHSLTIIHSKSQITESWESHAIWRDNLAMKNALQISSDNQTLCWVRPT